MAIEQRDGVLDQITEKGIVLSGARLSYSKWFEGEQPTDDLLGCKIRVVVDAGEKCTFLKKIVQVGQKTEGWTPPEPRNKGSFGGGGGRRFSPEELELKRDEGIRIARSVAVDRAITMVREGVSIDEIAPYAQAVEEYLLKGTLPKGPLAVRKEAPKGVAPEKPSASSSAGNPSKEERTVPSASGPKTDAASGQTLKTKKVSPLAVNALHKDAMRSGLVADWKDFHDLFRNVLRKEVKTPYSLTVEEFTKVESYVRSKLGHSKVA